MTVMRLSDSFSAAIQDLATELGASLVEWRGSDSATGGEAGGCLLLLAGGAESEAVDRLAEIPTSAHAYLVGAAEDHRLAAAAVQRGARDYFALPADLGLLRRTLERERTESLAREAAAQFAEGERKGSGFDAIIGESGPLRKVIDQARRVAKHRDVTVLIGGETGTGKELLARALHYDSPRAAAPFVEINCAAIPANLLESELFGHEKGAFTGAVAAKPGLMEMAHGGTVFLDEVGALPLELQPKLLRALETREIRRVGGQQSRKIDVRLVAATHLDLASAVKRGEFREDLYFRLNVVPLVLPPLRERGDDVERLAEAFAASLARQYGLPTPVLTPVTRATLRQHPWPGNVRELRNAVERALVLSAPGALEVDQLVAAEVAMPEGGGTLPFPATIRTINRAAVDAMLELVSGNKSEAARRLGISRPRLQRILDGTSDD